MVVIEKRGKTPTKSADGNKLHPFVNILKVHDSMLGRRLKDKVSFCNERYPIHNY